MPDGVTHYNLYKANWISVFPSFFVWLYYDPIFAFGYLFGYFSGRYVDPDADQPGLSGAEGRLFNELKIIGAVFVAYWFIYGYLFIGRHRHFLSHFPFVSTFIRCVYAYIPIYFLFRYLGYIPDLNFWKFCFGIFIGLSISDTSHTLADWLFRPKKRQIGRHIVTEYRLF